MSISSRGARASNAYRPPLRFTDGEGHPVVRVFLCDGTSAVADAEDFDRLIALGFSPRWFPNGDGKGRSYVSVAPPLGSPWKHHPRVNVARLIAPPASRGVVVKYADGDRLNLRSRNLVTRRGETNAMARESAFVRPQPEPSTTAGPTPHVNSEEHTMSTTSNPTRLPETILSEIERVRSYLDRLEERVVAFGTGFSDPADAIICAADVYQSLRATPHVRNIDGSSGFGSAARLDRMTMALVYLAGDLPGPLPFPSADGE